MTPKLSDDLRQVIEERGGSPVYVLDATTNLSYVVVRAEVFERMKALTGENEADAMYPLLASLDPEDWEDASNYGIPKP